jgi:hypothetical protein
MAKVEFNEANCDQLPINDVSQSIFNMTATDNEEAETELDESSHEVAEEKSTKTKFQTEKIDLKLELIAQWPEHSTSSGA